MDDEILGGMTVSERTGMPTAADRRLLAERLRYLVAGEDGWPTEGVGVALGLLDVVTAAAPRPPRGVPDAVGALADLVDVPRCRLVDRWDAARGRHYVDCTACRFGSRAEGLPEGHPMATLSRELWRTGAAEACLRCPVCGAEVERD